MKEQKYDYGMIGLGTMGRNLAFNMSDHGFSVAGFDKNTSQVALFKKEASNENVYATSELQEFLTVLNSPKTILLLVPAGKIVGEVIEELKPFLSEGDVILDCGNSHYTDTNIRIDQLVNSNIHFMGVGISGGESGARIGPSIMPGGVKEVYERIAPMLKAISAKVNNEPCVSWMGESSSGHYVKMVHNGIEYGLMQLIAETYHLLKVVGGMSNDELHSTFAKWNEGKLHSFLIEITAGIFLQKDELTSGYLIDMILDSARQKGTGGWTSEDALNLQVPIPVIDVAVTMRDLSAYKKDRIAIQEKIKFPLNNFNNNKEELVIYLEQALYFSMITTYTQGMSLLSSASKKYKYNLNLEHIASIWRGGCIIRASLLEDIRYVFSKQSDLANLLMSDIISNKLIDSQIGLRKIVTIGSEAGIPIPALMGSLAYFDSFRSGWLPANLLQAQRDCFGAHTYERNDRAGIFHTEWKQTK